MVYLLYFLNFLYISSFQGFTCRKLSSLNDVQILPSSCVLYNQRYGSICSFSCANGKQISGPSSVRCGIRGYWSEEENEVSCNGSYNSNFCFLLLVTIVFLLMFQASSNNNRVLKWWRHKNEISEIMGFVRIFWKNNVQEAYLPKMSISWQIVSEMLAG